MFTIKGSEMIRRILIFLMLIAVAGFSVAGELSVTNATVTKVQVYETTNDATSVWIHLNGNSRVGPNPSNHSNTCELWTNSNSVYSAALSALIAGKKVTVYYVDRGEGTYWCKVRNFAVSAN